MFKKAIKYDDIIDFYFTSNGIKWVAKDGSLSWRLNNPGLIPSRSPIAKKYGSIGSHSGFAIFSTAKQGYDGLKEWLRTKNLYEILKYYNRSISAFCHCILEAPQGIAHQMKFLDICFVL